MIERLPSTTAAKAEWDAFVRTSSAGSVFATSLFLDALGVSYDLWVTRKDAAIDAALPLVRGLCGLSTNPLYCKYLGLLPPPTDSLKPSTAASDFYGRVEAFAALLKATRSFDYTFHPAITNWMPFHWLGFRQQTHFTYVIPHTAKDTWWEEADSRLRRSVRRGKKADVIIRPGDVDSPADIAACYELSMLPFTSRGSPPVINRPRFEHLARTLGRSKVGRIWLAEVPHAGITSAALVLYDWNAAYFVFNGTATTAPTGTNSALLAHVIDNALDRGLNFDFEGSMIKSIEAYYRLFGPELRPYFRIWAPTAINLCKRLTVAAARRIGGYKR